MLWRGECTEEARVEDEKLAQEGGVDGPYVTLTGCGSNRQQEKLARTLSVQAIKDSVSALSGIVSHPVGAIGEQIGQ